MEGRGFELLEQGDCCADQVAVSAVIMRVVETGGAILVTIRKVAASKDEVLKQVGDPASVVLLIEPPCADDDVDPPSTGAIDALPLDAFERRIGGR